MTILLDTPVWTWWLVLSIFLIILEIFAPSFVLIWFAIGAGVALLGALIPGVGFGVQIGLFILASVAGLLLLRPLLRSRSNAAEDDRELNRFDTNLVGSPGTLTQAIQGGQGRARVGDSTWTVTGPDLPIQTPIRVISVHGIMLEVRPDDSDYTDSL